MDLSVRIVDAAGAPDPRLTRQFKRDLEREVGPADYPAAPPIPGARGGDLFTAAFVLGVLNAKAVVALVEVLKAWLTRDRTIEIEVEGPGGKARFKAADPHDLEASHIQARIEALLAPRSAPPPAT